jgi:hypothetical protein
MKKTRRYREKCNANTIGITSTYANERIHDFLKGWGTISKDGKSVLWDSYRPPTKKQREKLERHWRKNPPFSKIIFPVINKVMPELTIDQLVSVQPMTNLPSGSIFL